MMPLLDLLRRELFRREQPEWKLIAARAVREHQQSALSSTRVMLDLVVAWRISLEQPETDLRDDIDALIVKLSDQIAVMEEHSA